MEIEEVMEFLQAESLSAIFSDEGLKFLSLRPQPDTEHIDLRETATKKQQNLLAKLLVNETMNFLASGKHNMPLDFSDFTPFQRSVFSVVAAIEPGQTVTYKDVAIALGKPGGAQAVGNAIAKNPVAYFLPTHRVLPQKGIGICRTGAGHLREKLLAHEGHDLDKLRGNYICRRKQCVWDSNV